MRNSLCERIRIIESAKKRKKPTRATTLAGRFSRIRAEVIAHRKLYASTAAPYPPLAAIAGFLTFAEEFFIRHHRQLRVSLFHMGHVGIVFGHPDHQVQGAPDLAPPGQQLRQGARFAHAMAS
jgi:hypothetical protein